MTTETAHKPESSAQSIYFDLLRAFAALYVFLYHFTVQGIVGNFSFSPENYFIGLPITDFGAHCSVIIFFVMSGMLISESTSRQRPTFLEYLSARLGRIYSVMVPALIFSFAVAFYISENGRFSTTELPNTGHPIIRFLTNLTFTSQLWNLAATPPLNGPFWSLSYEFFYYMLFGVGTILKGWRRYTLLATLIAVGGPKLLLLAPCWFVGVAVSQARLQPISLNGLLLWRAVFFCSAFYMVFAVASGVSPPFWKTPGDHIILGYPTYWSWNWKSDYLFSALVGLNFLAHRKITALISSPPTRANVKCLSRVAAFFANCSFTLYLFHHPLFYLYSSSTSYQQTNHLHATALLLSTLLTIPFIAALTEWRVASWRRVVMKCILAIRISLALPRRAGS